jgi:hypothetical protein
MHAHVEKADGDHSQNNNDDFRPMTLRHYLSVILRFGRLVDLDQQRALILDAELCAAVFRRFCFYR